MTQRSPKSTMRGLRALRRIGKLCCMAKGMHLRLIDPSRNPWERQQEEPKEIYLEFAAWLQEERPRPDPPTPKLRSLALRWHWRDRARQYDAHRETPAHTPNRLMAAIGQMSEVLFLESRKLLEQARGPMNTLTPKELIALLNAFVQAREVAKELFGDDANAVDLSGFSDHELAVLNKLRRSSQRSGG